MALRVSDYMSSRVVVAEPRDTLARIRNLMLHNDISRVVVVEGSKPIGIVTETDISRVLLSESIRDSPRPIDSILVSEVMTSPVVSVGPRVYLKNAASLMIKGGFSGLPVVDGDGSLVGIITKTDIVRAYAEHYHGLCKVREVMSSPVVTVNPLHSIYRVGKLIEKHNIGRVVVLDGGRPVGIITKTDLTFRLAGYSPRKIKFEDESRRTIKTLRVPVASDIMTPNPLTIGDSEDVAKAAEIMISHKISGLPVVNDSGSLVGIITKTDIVRVVALRDLGV
ncbi:MAG: CBS domain-containing protein [archaeon YNP-LCB-024-027]|nr:CBS domain-containing protein [Candidatus Culexarchaeum yellowstonense]